MVVGGGGWSCLVVGGGAGGAGAGGAGGGGGGGGCGGDGGEAGAGTRARALPRKPSLFCLALLRNFDVHAVQDPGPATIAVQRAPALLVLLLMSLSLHLFGIGLCHQEFFDVVICYHDVRALSLPFSLLRGPPRHWGWVRGEGTALRRRDTLAPGRPRQNAGKLGHLCARAPGRLDDRAPERLYARKPNPQTPGRAGARRAGHS